MFTTINYKVYHFLIFWSNYIYSSFCWTMVQFVAPLITPNLDFVLPSTCTLKPGWFSHMHSFLPVHSDPKGYGWCYTWLFNQKGCTLYKHVYSRPISRHPSYQQRAGRYEDGLLAWWVSVLSIAFYMQIFLLRFTYTAHYYLSTLEGWPNIGRSTASLNFKRKIRNYRNLCCIQCYEMYSDFIPNMCLDPLYFPGDIKITCS